MQVITNVIKVPKQEYYVKHLQIINIILSDEKYPEKMSSKEIEVLAAFMSQEKVLIEDDMFNGIVRKKVMTQLNIKPGGLGNHLKSMIEKKFLIKNEITNKITIKPFLMPEVQQGFRIKLIEI